MARLAYMETFERINRLSLSAHLLARELIAAGPNVWQRGHRVGGWLGVSPMTWPAQLTLNNQDLTLRVRAPGQQLTESEARFWDSEWAALRRAVAGQPVPLGRLRQHQEAATTENGVLTATAASLGGVAGLTVGAVWGARRGALAGCVTTTAVMYLGGQLLQGERAKKR